MNSENLYRSPQTKTESTDATQSAPEIPTLTSILFSFQGRIPRGVYWGVGIPLWLIFAGFESFFNSAVAEDSVVAAIVVLLLFIPVFWIITAITVKRWHDRDKSGWWILIHFIPIIGPIWSLIEQGFMCGTVGANRFGADPTGDTQY
jgi:uncharacterized membrane protein YhaH (DUF805 family)